MITKRGSFCIPLALLVLQVFSKVSAKDEKSSLTFVIDDTSSMTDDIEQVKRDTNAIFDAVLSSNESQIENFVLLTFNDPTFSLRTITTRRDIFKEEVSKIFAHNVVNNECEEYSMHGIYEGIRNSLPRSTIYVFTDATSRDYEYYPQVKDIALRKQAQVVFVLTGSCGDVTSRMYQVYHELADATDGQVFHLESKTDVGPIMDYIIRNLKRRQTTITNVKIPPGKGNAAFNIDAGHKTPEVTLTGIDVRYDMSGPGNSPVVIDPIQNVPGVAYFAIPNPVIGPYQVNVSSPYGARVIVTANSKVKFQHGFSTIKPISIGETASRPLQGVKSYITIEQTEGELEFKIVQILIQRGTENILEKNITLTLLDKAHKLYITELEDLPMERFRLSVIGFDPTSKTYLTRTGPPIEPLPPTPVTPSETKEPIVTILGSNTLKNVPFDKPLQIKCKIEGYPMPDIIWVNKNTGDILRNSVRVLEPPDVFISTLDIEKVNSNCTYECKAVNVAGLDSKAVTVEMQKPFLTFVTNPKDIHVEYKKAGEIRCEVEAYPPAHITWYKGVKLLNIKDNIELSHNNAVLKIKEIHLEDDGNYICEARNEPFRKWKSAKITVTGVEPPLINKTLTQIIKPQGSDVDINCILLKGKPRPDISWFHEKEDTIKLVKWSNKETITLYNISEKDAGNYLCKATNDVDEDNHSVKLTVEYPPQIKNDVTEHLAKQGDSIILPCHVESKPEANFQWLKNGVVLNKSYKTFIFRDHSLKISNAILNDAGNYTCRAANKYGTATRVVDVRVHVPVSIALPQSTKFTVNVGATVSVQCKAEAYPAPSIEWIYHPFDRNITGKPLLSREPTLEIRHIQVDEEGYYTCIASNGITTFNISYEVHVHAAPQINNLYLNKKFVAVEGDLVTIIRCEATGNPPPFITWLKEDNDIATGDHFSIEAGELIIKNITTDDQGVYRCLARNDISTASEVYEVEVLKRLQPSRDKTTKVIEEGKPYSFKCDVDHVRTDLLRWFKDGVFIHRGELTLPSAVMADTGFYTCRVSNFVKSVNGITQDVIVGNGPMFVDEPDTNIDYVDGYWAELNCEADAYPTPEIHWWHNNELMDETSFSQEFEMEVGKQGTYACEVKNVFGSIVRYFNIRSKDCIIDFSKKLSKQPLMVSFNNHVFNWPQHEVKGGFMTINQKDHLNLFCPSGFKDFPKQTYSRAYCLSSKFKVRGKIYEYSDIKCNEEVTYRVERTGLNCYDGNTEMIHILYNIPRTKKFVEAYKVCLDKDNNRPLFTNLRMTNAISDVNYFQTEWSDYGELYLNFEEAYDCDKQNHETSSSLQRLFRKTDQCCFGKRQLVSPGDLPPGVAQKAAFNALNVVPQWSTCNDKSNYWNDVEQRVRALAKSSYSELEVSTGVSEALHLKDIYGYDRKITLSDRNRYQQTVPLFLWKVVQNPAEKSSLAIIQVNVPDISLYEATRRYVRCRDVCHLTEWMKGPWNDTSHGYIYCCSLEDFEDAFNFQGVFPPHDKLLKQVNAIQSHSLV